MQGPGYSIRSSMQAKTAFSCNTLEDICNSPTRTCHKLTQTQTTCRGSGGLLHLRCAGEEGIFMNDLGKHLQFPTRTFHKPSYLQDFLQRLGLIFTKEQKGKAVVVCVRAPAPLLATYRLVSRSVLLQHSLSLQPLRLALTPTLHLPCSLQSSATPPSHSI